MMIQLILGLNFKEAWMSAHITRIAIRVDQRFGSFFIIKFTAKELMQITFSDPLKKIDGKYTGTQRLLQPKRVNQIKKYIESVDCAFPNSIILAANFQENGLICAEEGKEWTVDKLPEFDDLYEITIPTDEKLASIIDGQHRLNGFSEVSLDEYDSELVCSVYFNLPNVFQAQLFATINSTQKSVDKSLAYELFGFDLEEDDYTTWSPDKLGIAMCRRFNEEVESPLFKHVKSAAIVEDANPVDEWQVSTSCVVDCIIRLISSNPQADKIFLRKSGYSNRKREVLNDNRRDNSPLRPLYLEYSDSVLYKIISNFFCAAINIYSDHFNGSSALCKTIGVQGLFDVLRLYSLKHKNAEGLHNVDFSQDAFGKILSPSSTIDFSCEFFMKFSGVGRARIRDVILVAADLKGIEDIKSDDSKAWIHNNLPNVDVC